MTRKSSVEDSHRLCFCGFLVWVVAGESVELLKKTGIDSC